MKIAIDFDGTSWTFSMYTTREDIDLADLAKSMGGGGHKKAAGFVVSQSEFNQLEFLYDQQRL